MEKNLTLSASSDKMSLPAGLILDPGSSKKPAENPKLLPEQREGVLALEYVIYGDVLVAVNFIIDLVILRLCQPLTGIRQKGLRPYLAAAAGGLCSMVIFFPASSLWVDLFIRLGFSFIVVSIAYGRQKPKVFLRLLGVFYAVSFLVAGVVLGLWFLFPRGGCAYRNGMIYLDLDPLLLIGSVAAAYLFVRLFEGIFHWGRGMGERYLFSAQRGERTVVFTALADTGNRLTEPFSGLPMVVLEEGKGRELLTPEECRWLESGMAAGEPPPGLRLAPYRTISGKGLLAAFRPQSLRARVGDRWVETDGYLALMPEKKGPEGCDGVFHPRMIQLAAEDAGERKGGTIHAGN